MKPWEFAEALTSDRLIAVGDVLRRARDSAARHAKPKLGDSLCSIGLVAFDRSCHALTLAAAHEFNAWLGVRVLDNHFIVRVGGIPIRFYRGDPDLPIPARTLRMGEAERLATQLALITYVERAPVKCLRFEVDKNERGFTRSVSFVMVGHDDDRFASWPIPRYSEAVGPRPGAVELPPISLDDEDEGEASGTVTR